MRSFFSKFLYSLLCASLISSLAGTQPAYAASLAVNSSADTVAIDGFCTLREAIINANNDNQSGSTDCPAGSGADTITFAGNYTITLAGSELPVVTTTIIINGNGVTNTVLQANVNPNVATNRIFQVTDTGNLTLDNLTIRNGRCNGACGGLFGGSGGGILNIGGVLTVTNSTLSNNSVRLFGGGISNYGTLTVMNSTFSSNSAGSGGGISNEFGTLTMMNSVLSGNSASTDGGTILNFSTLTVTSSTLFGNTAGTAGGGIYNTSTGTLIITDSTLSGNSATDGAGIYNTGTLEVINSKIISNSAYDWGGGIKNNGPLTVSNSTFSDNYADTYGGAIFNGLGGMLLLTHSTLSNNQAYEGGGMTILNGTVTVVNSTLANNSAFNDYGGGVYNYGGALAITNSTLSGNSAPDGGGIYNRIGSTNLYNTLVVNSPSGLNCVQAGGTITADSANLDTDGTCDNATQKISSQVNLQLLADNGGATQTMALGTGSVAIDAGDPTICANSSVNNEDQRGVARPQGVGCDIGAYEADVLTPAPALPNTGFAPNRITSLAPQPANLAYSNLGDIWLEIPALNIKTNIVGVPKSNNNTWDVSWLGKDTGWLNGTAFPSWDGNSVLTAHVTDSNGMPGPFANIKNLKYGNQVIVHLYGQKYIFEVRNTRRVRPNATQFAFQHLEDHSYLTLITCQGYNPISDSYLFRRIIRAVLVDVQSE